MVISLVDFSFFIKVRMERSEMPVFFDNLLSIRYMGKQICFISLYSFII